MVGKTLKTKPDGKQTPKKKKTSVKAPKAEPSPEIESKMDIEQDQDSAARDVGVENTIFVSNLPTGTTQSQLYKLFNSCGNIVLVLIAPPNAKNGVTAHIVFDSAEAPIKALELNGKKIGSNALIVKKPDDVQVAINPERKEKKYIEGTENDTVFVQNLDKSTTQVSLKNFLSDCGEIQFAKILRNHLTKQSRGKAFVCFKDPESASAALKLSGTKLEGQVLIIEPYIRQPIKTPRSFNKDSKKPQKKVASEEE